MIIALQFEPNTTHVRAAPYRSTAKPCSMDRGNHLSNTPCLAHVFFKRGESCSNVW